MSYWDMFKFWASSEEFATEDYGPINDFSGPEDYEINPEIFNHDEDETEGPTEEGEILGFTYDEIFGDKLILENIPRTTTTTTTTTTPKPVDPSYELNAWFKKKNLIFDGIRNAQTDKDILDMIKDG